MHFRMKNPDVWRTKATFLLKTSSKFIYSEDRMDRSSDANSVVQFMKYVNNKCTMADHIPQGVTSG